MNATLFLDAALDALLDSLRMLPFLFVAFLILEALEHYSSNRLTHFFQHKKGGPAIAAARQLAMDTARIAFAPKLDLSFVPSAAFIAASTA